MDLRAPYRIGPGKRTHAKRTNGPSMYAPHQGKRERVRRLRQVEHFARDDDGPQFIEHIRWCARRAA